MSRRLTALRVGNFKAFADTQTIPLKPITLIFGPNSAGKSSFIHSLALAHEAQFGREKRSLTRLDVHHTDVGGSAIDLGGFRQYVHRGQLRKRVEWGAELSVAVLAEGKDKRLAQLLAPVSKVALSISLGIELDDLDRPKSGAGPRVESIEITGDDVELMRMSRRRTDSQGSTLRLDRIASDHQVFRQVLKAIVESATTSEEMRPDDFDGANEAIADLLPQLLIRVEQFFPSGVELPNIEGADLSPVNTLFPISRGNRKEDIAQAVRFYLPRTLNDLVKGISEALSEELRQLQYLGPLRSFPPRHLAFSEHEDANWYAGGGYAWDVVRRDESVREAVNSWLGQEKLKTPYRLVVQPMAALSDLSGPIEEALWKIKRASVNLPINLMLDTMIEPLEETREEAYRAYETAERNHAELQMQYERLLVDAGATERTNLRIDEARAKTLEDSKLQLVLLSERRDDQIKRGLHDLVKVTDEDIRNARDRIKTFEAARTKRQAGEADDRTRQNALKQLLHAIDKAKNDLEKAKQQVTLRENVIEKFRRVELLAKQENDLAGHSDVESAPSNLGIWEDSNLPLELFMNEISQADIERVTELKLVDILKNTSVTHRDVGIGISQVLPVLVTAYASKSRLIAMEQPEIHLHPALQAELGDVFIEAALGDRKNTFILETHSEHLILRLMRRMRETYLKKETGLPPVTPTDVCVLYVEPDGTRSIVREMPLNELGELAKSWPGGFFEEGLREQFGDA